jgi:hypothetical protein
MKRLLTIGLTALLLVTTCTSSAFAATAPTDRSVLFTILASLEEKVLVIQQSIADLRAQLTASVGTTTQVLDTSSPRTQTTQLLALTNQYNHTTGSTARAALLAKLTTAAQARKTALLALIAADPSAALTTVLPSKIKHSLPESVQSLIEEETTIDGTLDVMHQDDFEHNLSTYLYTVNTVAGAHYTLHVNHDLHVQSGTHVRVTGSTLDTTLLADTTNIT